MPVLCGGQVVVYYAVTVGIQWQSSENVIALRRELLSMAELIKGLRV